jgi:aspartyl-tRNA(Asn)/glutamyl-tRNA(Gln) amidotransferase subunit C
MAQIGRDQVGALARLANIAISDAEADSLQGDLDAILGYIEQLKAVDVSGYEPAVEVTGLSNVTRPDTVQDYGYRPKDLLKQVPAVEDGQIKVKRMIG